MRVDLHQTENHLVAKLSGRMSFSDHGQFRKVLDGIRADGIKTCVLDVATLEAIDSSGLGMLMLAIEDARKGGWSLTVANAAGPVKQLLQLSRLDKMLKVA
ncbi:STAS domain protein [Asticcacaulis biprosthecium C19]|uniref:STAS domain protein n=1 Tax=Asticcacaulis biprosthecium C19 TaxID=715226 RepID=F4QTB7_9CAUL|nr:STAS domain-containing protein [Asticcacaulis biprosthecium]EGF89987.1 STAS domain protein [Asticcacaulis biprosthecium C19]